MGEKNREFDIQRIGQIRAAIEQAKKENVVGIEEPGERRQEVIKRVAREHIDEEEQRTKDTAVNKYLEVKEGEIPVLITAVHAQPPTVSEVRQLLSWWEKLTQKEIEEAKVRIDQGTTQGELDSDIRRAFDRYDEKTDLLARQAARLAKANLVVAKRSRLLADLNRSWWKRGDFFFHQIWAKAKEYSQSARAAFYWAAKPRVEKAVGLDETGIARAPFLHLALHGMKNREDFDIILGGTSIVDPPVLEWFNRRLSEEIEKRNLIGAKGERAKVVIASPNDLATEDYIGDPSLAHYRRAPLKNPLQHPFWGGNFNTIQLEISNRLRTDEGKREILGQIIADLAKEFPSVFHEKREPWVRMEE